MSELTVIKDEYTRKVSGEEFQYDAQFKVGERVEWSAHVYLNGELKGELKGNVIDNTMDGEALKQYIVAYIEGMIERGLGIEE
jgi:hypothetical protein